MVLRMRLLTVFLVGPLLGAPIQTLAATYYVDASAGADGNAGTSDATPWRTLDKVNATTFQPGDRILFRAGAVWTGRLWPRGSGTDARPIVIDRYGEGPKPQIRGAGAEAALYLENQEFWEISNLDVTNEAPTPGYRRGVLVRGTNLGGALRHVHLRGLDVHRVTGKLGAEIPEKTTGGIGIEATGTDRPTRFDDVLIEGCTVRMVDSTGIYTWSEAAPHPRDPRWEGTRNTNVRIRRNRLVDIGKNAITVRGTLAPVIEWNVVERAAARLHGNALYVFGCKDAVMQFNEVFATRFDGLEGAAFDSDYNSEGTIIQFNYSHDNGGGLVNLCNNPASRPPRGYNDGTIVRNNISQNETERVIAFDGPVTNTIVENNTIYVGPGLSPRIVEFDTFGKTPGHASRARFSRNIVHNAGGGTYAWGESRDVSFDGNCFFGTHPAGEPTDAAKVTADPLFVLPGSGGIGLDSLLGYRLRPMSPCAHAGAGAVANGEKSFWDVTAPPATRAKAFADVAITHDIEFARPVDEAGASVPLSLDVYQPAGDSRPSRPVIIWVHGGGFRPPVDKRQGYLVTLAKEFARRGYVSVAPDYRVRAEPNRDRAGTIRDAVNDIEAAVEWLGTQSGRFRVAIDQVVIAGGSAGGKATVGVVSLATTPDRSRPVWSPRAAVVLWGSPEASYVVAQPSAAFPPTLLIHGTSDDSVPYTLSAELASKLTAQGGDVVLLPLPGAAHTPVEQMPLIIDTIARFLGRVLDAPPRS